MSRTQHDLIFKVVNINSCVSSKIYLTAERNSYKVPKVKLIGHEFARTFASIYSL